MDTDSFIVYIKTEDIEKDVETRFDTSNYKLDRLLLKEKNKEVIGLIKDQIDGKIMKELAALTAKTYRYLTNSNNKDKKPKSQKSVL